MTLREWLNNRRSQYNVAAGRNSIDLGTAPAQGQPVLGTNPPWGNAYTASAYYPLPTFNHALSFGSVVRVIQNSTSPLNL